MFLTLGFGLCRGTFALVFDADLLGLLCLRELTFDEYELLVGSVQLGAKLGTGGFQL